MMLQVNRSLRTGRTIVAGARGLGLTRKGHECPISCCGYPFVTPEGN